MNDVKVSSGSVGFCSEKIKDPGQELNSDIPLGLPALPNRKLEDSTMDFSEECPFGILASLVVPRGPVLQYLFIQAPPALVSQKHPGQDPNERFQIVAIEALYLPLSVVVSKQVYGHERQRSRSFASKVPLVLAVGGNKAQVPVVEYASPLAHRRAFLVLLLGQDHDVVETRIAVLNAELPELVVTCSTGGIRSGRLEEWLGDTRERKLTDDSLEPSLEEVGAAERGDGLQSCEHDDPQDAGPTSFGLIEVHCSAYSVRVPMSSFQVRRSSECRKVLFDSRILGTERSCGFDDLRLGHLTGLWPVDLHRHRSLRCGAEAYVRASSR